MFGLEKKERKLFEFDLEKELKSNPLKAKELLKTTEARIQAVKTALRQGADSADFNKLSGLLLGYSALQKVLTKIANKK